MDCHGGGCARALASDGAAHHVAGGCVRDLVSSDAAPRNQQVVDPCGHHAAIRHLKVAARRGKDQDAVAVHEFGKDADDVVEASLPTDVAACEVVAADDLARVTGAQRHAKVPQLRLLEARHALPQCLQGMQRLLTAFHLCTGKVPNVSHVHTLEVNKVQVCGFACIGQRAPRTTEVLGALIVRDDALLACVLKLRVQVWATQSILLMAAIPLLLPEATPVLVRPWIVLGVLQEAALVHTRAVEDGGCTKGLLLGADRVSGTSEVGDVGIARAVDHALSEDGQPA
mmetsp:Transcript_90773/g.265709  ORF Transcript_90773/g.265709 Transcript_90773/m.265709 type:complete len:285 (+) Transcript_90773:377-1231(+)